MSLVAIDFPTGRFLVLTTRARSKEAAIRAARREARSERFRTIDVSSAIEQGDGLTWRVELRVVPR